MSHTGARASCLGYLFLSSTGIVLSITSLALFRPQLWCHPEGGWRQDSYERKARLMAKKKNSRKALAVALGIMGIAGLSLASASQLNITASPGNLATGTQTFAAACDDTVSVAYTTGVAANGTATYTGFVISGIADACKTSLLSYTLGYSTYAGGVYTAATALTASNVAVVAAAADNNTVTVTFAPVMPGSNRLDNIAITIK